MANSTNRLLCKNKFHAVQHDECDDVCVAKLYDNFAKIVPTSVDPNMYATTCVSATKKIQTKLITSPLYKSERKKKNNFIFIKYRLHKLLQ